MKTTIFRDTCLLFPEWNPLNRLPEEVRSLIALDSAEEEWNAQKVTLHAQVRILQEAKINLGELVLALGRPGEPFFRVGLEVTFSAPVLFKAISNLLLNASLVAKEEISELATTFEIEVGR